MPWGSGWEIPNNTSQGSLMVFNAMNPKYGGAVAGDWGPAIRAAITDAGSAIIFVGAGIKTISSADGNGNAFTLPNAYSRLAGSGPGGSRLRIAVAVTWGIELQAAYSGVVDLELDITTGGSATYGVGIDTPASPGSAESCYFERVLVQKILSGTLTNAFAVGPTHTGASNIDIAYTTFNDCRAVAPTNACWLLGNGTGGNILDTHLDMCFAVQGQYGVYADQTAFTWTNGDVYGHTTANFRISNNAGKNCLIQGVESETS